MRMCGIALGNVRCALLVVRSPRFYLVRTRVRDGYGGRSEFPDERIRGLVNARYHGDDFFEDLPDS